jgi:hypothetical protein
MPGDQKSKQKESAKASSRARGGSRIGVDPEQSARLLLIGGVAAIIVVALGFIAFGWYWTEKRPEGRTVLQVDEYKVSFASMKRRMNYELFRNTTLQQSPGALPSFAFDNLVLELTKVARADTIPVTVDDATVEAALRTRIGAADGADQRTFQDALRRQLEATGLNESEYRRLVLGEALERAIVEHFQGLLPATLLQARVEAINAETLEDAEAAIERINAGEPFADVARDISIDPTVQDTGGLRDYGPEGSFADAYDAFAFSAQIGTLSAPLQSPGSANYYVVRVVDRSEQPIADDRKPSLARDDYDEWLQNTREELESSGALVNKFDEGDQQEALVDVYSGARGRLQEQARQAAEQQILQQTAVAVLTQSPEPTMAPLAPGTEDTPELNGEQLTPPSQPVAPSMP